LEALLPIGIPWQDVQVELLRCDMTALKKGLQEPQALLDSLIRQTGPLAAKFAIQQAKPVLQTLVEKGVSWKDIEDSLKAVEIHDLVEGLKDPRRFIAEVERTAGPPARAWVLVKVKAAVAAVLPPDVAWEDLDGIENTVGEMSLEELRQDLMQPNRLLMSLASKFHPLAVKLAFIRLWGGMRELLEKYLGIDDVPVRSEEVKMIMQQILNKAEADEIKAAWRSGRPADQFHNLCEIFSHQLNSEPTTLQALFAAILVPKVKECLPDVAWEDLKAVLANLSLDDLAIFRKRLSSLEGTWVFAVLRRTQGLHG
jgi:hypothetical protein